MNVLLRVLAILAMAVALTIAVKYNTGYVVLIYPPYRAEFSLSLLIVMLLALFFLAYGLLRLGAHTLNLPAEVHAFKQERQREKARPPCGTGGSVCCRPLRPGGKTRR